MNSLSKKIFSLCLAFSIFSCTSEQPVLDNNLNPSNTEVEALAKKNKLVDLLGIGEAFAQKLNEQGITTPDQYLKAAAKRYDRVKLSEKTGISTKLLLDWANYIDLMSIKGVGPTFSQLLESEGVDSVKELALRNSENLANRINAAYKASNNCNREPVSIKQVSGWIDQAQKGGQVEDDLIPSADFTFLSDNKSNRFKVSELIGVGEVYSKKLSEQGIVYTDQYLKAAAKRYDRQKLSDKTGISKELLLDWVNYVDLMSLDGIGPVYARKLEYYGIDSVKELSHRRPDQIQIYFNYIYTDTCSKQVPSLNQFQSWVEKAKRSTTVEQ